MSRPINPRTIGRLSGAARRAMAPSLRTLWPTTIEGLGHIPRLGPAIIAPNHLSEFDSALLIGALPRRITFLGKAEYLDDWTTRWLFPAVGMIPVARTGGRDAQDALDTATARLDRGELLGVYPEGTRSRDGFLHRGKTGAARLALRTGAPIVPVGIIGSDRIQPCDRSTPRMFRSATLRFGAPIDPADYLEQLGAERVHRRLTDDLMRRIQLLSGQAYVDTYTGAAANGTRLPAPPSVANDRAG